MPEAELNDSPPDFFNCSSSFKSNEYSQESSDQEMSQVKINIMMCCHVVITPGTEQQPIFLPAREPGVLSTFWTQPAR
jgi:hypothetical protein